MIIFDELGWELTWLKREDTWLNKWDILYLYLSRVFPEEISKKIVRYLVRYEDKFYINSQICYPLSHEPKMHEKLLMSIQYIGSYRGVRSNKYSVAASAWGIKNIYKDEVSLKDKIEDIQILPYHVISACVKYP